MREIILFILACYGLTQILCYGKIFDKWRPKSGKLGELFSCSMCMGFWSGIFFGVIDHFTRLLSLSTNIVDIFILACISSGTSYILDKIVGDDGIRLEKR